MNKTLNVFGEFNSQNVYYNGIMVQGQELNTNIIRQDDQNPTPVRFYDNLGGKQIISNPREYKLVIERFDLSGAQIPIRNMILEDPSTNFTDLEQSITLEFGGFVVQQQIIWEPELQNVTVPPAIPELKNTFFYYLYSYAHWVRLVNQAFATAFAALAALVALPTTNPPMMVFNTSSQTFDFVVDSTYLNQSIAAGLPASVLVYFNEAMYGLHYDVHAHYINTVSADGRNYLLEFMNTGNNLVDQTGLAPFKYYDVYANTNAPIVALLYEFLGEYKILGAFSNISGLVLTSTLPTRKEGVNPVSYSYENSFQNSSGWEPILADFTLAGPTEAVGAARQVLNFAAAYPRYIDLTGSVPVQEIIVNVYMKQSNGQLLPLLLLENGYFSFKLGFHHVTTIT